MDMFDWDPNDRGSELDALDCPPPEGFAEMMQAHHNINPDPNIWRAAVKRSRRLHQKEQETNLIGQQLCQGYDNVKSRETWLQDHESVVKRKAAIIDQNWKEHP
jgi:hypothetical protein